MKGTAKFVKQLETVQRCYTQKSWNRDFVSGTWTYQKEERNIPVVGRRTWLQICARVAQ